jgi:predicted RNase H-like nuclease (RuvC/YqgF family)
MTPDRAAGVDRPADPRTSANERTRQLELELDAARATIREQQHELDARERKLERLQSTGSERDFQLASMAKILARSEPLLDGWRRTARQQEQELMDGESQLIETELRAERLENTLASFRSGRAYILMRVMWRLRRIFKRG